MTAEEFIEKKTQEWEKKDTIKTKIKTEDSEYIIVWKKEAFCFLPQSNYRKKVLVFERLRLNNIIGNSPKDQEKIGQVEYRISYYISRDQKNWIFARSCPLIPTKDFEDLLNKAKAENVLL